MVDRPEHARWRREAERALDTARNAAATGSDNWSCFLSEQAAQLALKSILHGIGRGTRGHDLVELAALVATELAEGWQVDQAVLMRLALHYIPTRYADSHAGGASPSERYGPDQSAQAVEDAVMVLAAVDRSWTMLDDEASS